MSSTKLNNKTAAKAVEGYMQQLDHELERIVHTLVEMMEHHEREE